MNYNGERLGNTLKLKTSVVWSDMSIIRSLLLFFKVYVAVVHPLIVKGNFVVTETLLEVFKNSLNFHKTTSFSTSCPR